MSGLSQGTTGMLSSEKENPSESLWAGQKCDKMCDKMCDFLCEKCVIPLQVVVYENV